MNRTALAALLVLVAFAPRASAAQITRVWITCRANTPSGVVFNWESPQPGDSVVSLHADGDAPRIVRVDEHVTLHHVEVPLERKDVVYHYTVATGPDTSADATFKAMPTDTLRAAVVADWQGRPNLDALPKDDVHVLFTAGDNVDSLHRLCGPGRKDCTKPYAALVDAYPALFRSTLFMPCLGNHDKEIRPRGDKPPADPVYDVDATAYLTYFPLPDPGWHWHLDFPDFDARVVALDLQHVSDFGTTWQTCHDWHRGSPQFDAYDKLMADPARPAFVITLHNERNADMRSREKGAWHQMFARGTCVITGFGYFAERADVDGFPYYNTSLSGTGAKYPDPKSKAFFSQDTYVLLTLTRNPKRLTVDLKSLDGKTLDHRDYAPRQ